MDEGSEHLGIQELRIGDVLGRYELVCVLAQGGMGSVWLAKANGIHGFERLVALKTILPAFRSDERFRTMFLDEARIASRIVHENVVSIFRRSAGGVSIILRSRIPESDICRVRGIGVAVSARQSRFVRICRSFSLCETPNRCSSSIIKSPRDL